MVVETKKVRIYAVGDTHTPIDIHKLNTKNFPEQKDMTKDDYIIICGDFGLFWENIMDETELYWMKWLNNKNFTTLFLDGNHENHKRLFSGMTAQEVIKNGLSSQEYVIEEKFGGYVGKISDSIYHLRRGEIYIINEKKFFVMGGAVSYDKYTRKKDLTWWKEEEPNKKEVDYGLDNLEHHGNKVDYILSHTAPQSIILKYVDKYWDCSYTEKFLDYVINTVIFKDLYCGHAHIDNDFEDRYHLLFQNIRLID